MFPDAQPFSLMTTLTSYETARARGNSYRIFSQLFDAGVTSEALPYVRSIPELSAAAAELAGPDLAAATHQRLFGFNVFAHESMFLSPEALLGGPVSERVTQFTFQAGFDPGSSENADQIARELGLLAFLCDAEIDAWRDQQTGETERMRALQRTFLDDHLLRWLPGLATAIGQQDEPLYAAAASLLLDLALDHRAGLGDDLHSAAAPFTLPAAPDPLASQRAGLRDVAEFLLTTAYSGIYLSRDDISRLGRQRNLPTGFGSRRLMLTNLLRSAAEFDALPPLLSDIQTLLARWQAGYAALDESPAAAVRAIGAVWSARLQETASLLNRLNEAAWQKSASQPESSDA